MIFSRLFLASAAIAGASAAPSYDLISDTPATPLYNWISSSLSQFVTSTKEVVRPSEYNSILPSDVKAFGDKPDFPDKTIWEVIQESEYLTDLKKVLKYAGPGAKELLDDKEKKLTFLAPINWNHKKDHEEVAIAQWEPVQSRIDELENDSLWSQTKEDDDRKEQKKKAIAYLIDQTLKYHVVDHKTPLTADQIVQNSSVATLLNIGDGKAKDVLGDLWDGEQFRLRVGKSLLPVPSAYFNFYSRLVYPDVNVGGSLVHAVSFPILIPPSALQTLFFGQGVFSTLTSALQKVDAEGYLKIPLNRSAIPHHHHNDHKERYAISKETTPHHRHSAAPGQGSLTLFAPANLAWNRLPIKLKLFLFSPFGEGVLGKVLALHSLPKTIFFADFVHELHDKKVDVKQYSINAPKLMAATGELAVDNGNVTEYTFDTACPKLHYNKTSDAWLESKEEFEQVTVKVYRYFILPGGKGPLQTRISVNEVPVLIQDIATANGGIHQIERFIMPKGHGEEGEEGVWAHAIHQAEKAGFGKISLADLH